MALLDVRNWSSQGCHASTRGPSPRRLLHRHQFVLPAPVPQGEREHAAWDEDEGKPHKEASMRLSKRLGTNPSKRTTAPSNDNNSLSVHPVSIVVTSLGGESTNIVLTTNWLYNGNRRSRTTLSAATHVGPMQPEVAIFAEVFKDFERSRIKSSKVRMNTEEMLLEAISDPGERLAAARKDFMESRFGAALGDIRIHYSAASDALNRTFGSLAFAIDDHIGFRTGFNESCGRLFLHVLAHELVHVLQKRKSRQAPNQTPGSALVLEVEADRIACEVLAATRVSVFTADSPGIARFWGPAGHYWTIYLISLAAGWSRQAALTNAFYAQMPDQVDELDATEAGENYLKIYAEKLLTPKAFSGTFNREISQLNTDKIVQRGLHALTGRIGKDETDIRQAIIKRLSPGESGYF